MGIINSSQTEACGHITECCGLKARNFIASVKYIVFFISGDTIKIKVNENSSPLSVTHVDDFGKHFPDVDLLPPSLTN